MKVLITAGNTSIPIDQVRCITNIFKGRTGANIAGYFDYMGDEVALLTSDASLAQEIIGESKVEYHSYQTYSELKSSMEFLIKTEDYDVIIHSAAVSDYDVAGVYEYVDGYGGTFSSHKVLEKIDSSGKVGSNYDELYLKLVPTSKIIDLIRNEWGFTGILVKFKLQVGISDEELLEIARKSMYHSAADFIVANCLEWHNQRAYILNSKSSAYEQVSRDFLPAFLYKAVLESPK